MNGYSGDCLVTRIDDPVEGAKLRIDRADKRIRIDAEVIAEAVRSQHPDVTFADGVLRMVGVNRTVAYRVGEIDDDGTYRAERIDES